MRKKLRFYLIISLFFLLAGCAKGEEEAFQIASLESIDTIHIDYGSTKLQLISDDTVDDLELSLLHYDGGPGISLNEGSGSLHIGVKNSTFRLFNLQRMPKLEVRIPDSYTGTVIADGTSGTMEGLNLQIPSLKVSGSSGKVTLDFLELQGDVSVKTSSGNVDVTLNDATSDASVTMKSKSGSHSLGLILDQKSDDGNETSGILGNGTHHIHLETTSGNISIR